MRGPTWGAISTSDGDSRTSRHVCAVDVEVQYSVHSKREICPVSPSVCDGVGREPWEALAEVVHEG